MLLTTEVASFAPSPLLTRPATSLTAIKDKEDMAKDEKDPVQMARLSLEMHWSLEETKEDCLVEDPSTCGSEQCSQCLGTGQSVCRFCRGTMQNYYNGAFTKCPVCDNGTEVCKPCRGSGWIAEWTQMGNDGELKP